MTSDISIENARRLRPGRPIHIQPGAQPIGSHVELILEGIEERPRAILTDANRNYTWQAVMEADGPARWKTQVMMPRKPTLLRYYFQIGEAAEHHEPRIIRDRRQVEGYNQPVYREWHDLDYKIGVYDPKRMPPQWTQGVMIYQIFPDRFARSNPDQSLEHTGVYGHRAKFMQWGDQPEAPPMGRDFFGGNLRGIIEKLDYLKELGVECLYLNPIFEAPTNHRYEAIDFKRIDPMLGSEEDFDEFVRECKARDMRIVLDAVFNHCSSDSIYFDITGKQTQRTGLAGAAQSQDSPYFRWFNFKEWPTDYDGWLSFGFMPELVECPEMEDYFIYAEDSVTRYWLNKGIDGWRADVPFDNTDEFWRRFRDAVDETNTEAYLISEEWRDATRYMLGDMFSATMNYRFTWAVRGLLATDDLTPSEFDDRMTLWMLDTPDPAIKAQMNLLDSHDSDRLITVCNGDRRRFKQTIAFQFAYPGAPSVYYGTETGLQGAYAEDGRRTMPWDNLDPELSDFIKLVISKRKTSDVLRHGDTETIVIDDIRRVYVFARRLEKEIVYAVFNASDEATGVMIPLKSGESGTFEDMLGINAAVKAKDGKLMVEIEARSMAWYSAKTS